MMVPSVLKVFEWKHYVESFCTFNIIIISFLVFSTIVITEERIKARPSSD